MIIGIIHHPDNRPFLNDLLSSLKGVKYPICIVINEGTKRIKGYKCIPNPEGGYELGALKRLLESTSDEDIFLIQDTFLVKDLELFDIANEVPGSLAVSKGFFHYTGKYKRSILEQVGIPEARTKQDAIRHEYDWSIRYANADPEISMLDDALADDMPSMRYEEKHGRLNKVLENEYVIKFKGNWGQL